MLQKLANTFLVFALLLITPEFATADSIPKNLKGDWTLNLKTSEPAWLSLFEKDGKPFARMRVYIGSDGPYEITKIADGRVTFPIKPLRKSRKSKSFTARTVEVGFTDGKLDGTIIHSPNDGSSGKQISFTGKRIPPMPASPPDLSQVKFGDRISLFNGKDLTGWRPNEKDKINGWSAKDGMLVNTRRKPTSAQPATTPTLELTPSSKTFDCASNSSSRKIATAESTCAACTRLRWLTATAGCRACRESARSSAESLLQKTPANPAASGRRTISLWLTGTSPSC